MGDLSFNKVETFNGVSVHKNYIIRDMSADWRITHNIMSLASTDLKNL